MSDIVSRLPEKVARRILLLFSIGERARLEQVCRNWRGMVEQTYPLEQKPVWLYVVFRKGHPSGHEKLFLNASYDGPVFWNRLVVYVYCCSCHFQQKHEAQLLSLFGRLSHRVERLCLVDSPVDYAFLTDAFFVHVQAHFPLLQFLYLRELDLQNVSFATVQKLAAHSTLKRVVVHRCRRFDAFTDFGTLSQLLVVQGDIQGMKQLMAGLDLDGFAAEDQKNAAIAAAERDLHDMGIEEADV